MSKNIIKTLTYGAVEDIDVTLENPYIYTGYCKKLGSDEICEVEVFINDELVDTLKADALVESVDKTYSCGNHCFVYEADKELFDQGNVIRFKQGGEDILGSPMVMKYNEHCFMQSLKEPIDEEKIKDMYTPNAIGFLATEENLADEEFVAYIKELMERFPDVEFKGFCFTEPIHLSDLKVEKLNINNAAELSKYIKILIANPGTSLDEILVRIYFNKLVAIITYKHQNMDKKIQDIVNEKLINLYNNNLDTFGLIPEDIEKYPSHYLLASLILSKSLDVEFKKKLLNQEQTIKEHNTQIITVSLQNKDFIDAANKLRKMIRRLLLKE